MLNVTLQLFDGPFSDAPEENGLFFKFYFFPDHLQGSTFLLVRRNVLPFTKKKQLLVKVLANTRDDKTQRFKKGTSSEVHRF